MISEIQHQASRLSFAKIERHIIEIQPEEIHVFQPSSSTSSKIEGCWDGINYAKLYHAGNANHRSVGIDVDVFDNVNAELPAFPSLVVMLDRRTKKTIQKPVKKFVSKDTKEDMRLTMMKNRKCRVPIHADPCTSMRFSDTRVSSESVIQVGCFL